MLSLSVQRTVRTAGAQSARVRHVCCQVQTFSSVALTAGKRRRIACSHDTGAFILLQSLTNCSFGRRNTYVARRGFADGPGLSEPGAPKVDGMVDGSASPSDNGPAPDGPPYDILFMGNDTFAVAILESLLGRKDLIRSIHVRTVADNRQKWGATRMRVSPVKVYAAKNGIPFEEIEEQVPTLDALKLPPVFQTQKKDSILITASFGKLIPDQTLQWFTKASPSLAINVHPSLLPDLRGAAPIQWAIARRYEQTGATIQQLSEGKFDRGKILSQRKVPLPADARYETVAPMMSFLSSELLLDTLSSLPDRHREARPQDNSKASYAPKITLADSIVDWEKQTAEEIEARHRAFNYLMPLRTYLWPRDQGRRLTETIEPAVRIVLQDLSLPFPSLKAFSDQAADRLCKRPIGRAWLEPAPPQTLIIKTRSDAAAVKEQQQRVAMAAYSAQYVEAQQFYTEEALKADMSFGGKRVIRLNRKRVALLGVDPKLTFGNRGLQTADSKHPPPRSAGKSRSAAAVDAWDKVTREEEITEDELELIRDKLDFIDGEGSDGEVVVMAKSLPEQAHDGDAQSAAAKKDGAGDAGSTAKGDVQASAAPPMKEVAKGKDPVAVPTNQGASSEAADKPEQSKAPETPFEQQLLPMPLPYPRTSTRKSETPETVQGLLVHKLQVESKGQMPMREWWKSQADRRNGFMQLVFGPQPTAEWEKARVKHNEEAKEAKEAAKEKWAERKGKGAEFRREQALLDPNIERRVKGHRGMEYMAQGEFQAEDRHAKEAEMAWRRANGKLSFRVRRALEGDLLRER